METWLSGRKHLTANEAGRKNPRRFESVRLRKFSKSVSGCKIENNKNIGRGTKR